MELIEISSADPEDPMWEILDKECLKSPLKRKMSACLLKRGRIIAKAYNSPKTHSRWGSKHLYHTLHCEGNLLWLCEKRGIDTKGLVVVVYRKNFLYAKPCADCQRHLLNAGIKRVLYTSKIPLIG